MASGSKVHPVPPFQPQYILAALGVLQRTFDAVQNYWGGVQVGHRGRYSVQRLLSFRDYCQRTSSTRVLLVCTGSLVPAFLTATLVECIPLQSPDEGWKANYMFWIRLYLSSLPIAFGAVYQVKEVIEPNVISTTGIVVTGVGSCTCYVALTMAIASQWRFPIPFGYVLTVAPFVFLYMAFFMLSIGPRVLAKSAILRHQIFSQMLVIAAQGVLAIAYPTFSAVFNQLSGNQQAAFIFVLPVIKFCIKQVIAKASAHLHECVALIVVFSVDVCNVLYVVVCMQTATSPLTTTLMITLDSFFVVLALRSIYYQSAVSQARRKRPASPPAARVDYLQDLMDLIRDAFRGRSMVSVPIRVLSPVPLPLSVESTRFMSELVHAKQRHGNHADFSMHLTKCSPTSARLESVRTTTWTSNRQLILRELEPALSSVIPTTVSKTVVSTAYQNRIAPAEDQASAIEDAQDSLQVLFHSEYVVMAEFIEFAIPLLYAVYLTVLYHLPTAVYYPHTHSLTPDQFANAQINLLMYSSVELTLFAGLNLLLKRTFGFSPLYQLAFVLETQVATLQGHLFLWISVILPMTLVHNGVDLKTPFK
ncbi:hypothetical protein PHYPSEUDO_005184 [Phytophthora pseudosyringae]|uniref:Transmembrane protein n=1 Tax=Phytophthora pseudosyringae TaxID=221518 RepID=A0A8T1VPK2_9STRA|nr:hypothetical protein PHYPSEUDO_005184 [Phytophthora pseudosyringae]